jgi:hypothetical protein
MQTKLRTYGTIPNKNIFPLELILAVNQIYGPPSIFEKYRKNEIDINNLLKIEDEIEIKPLRV